MGATNTRANRAAASGPEKGSMDVAHLLEEFREVGTVNSILVRKNDEMLIEYYTGRMNADQPANIKSASKSILSLLVGIAIEKGYLEGVDQTLHSFFPDYFREEENSEKASITLRDLLTMRSGLQTTSFTRYLEWISSNNWVRFVLERPLIYKTGVEMAYSTGTSHLLSAILTHASGMSTREFAEKYLFGPMGIEIAFWEQDPQGYYLGGNDLAIRPEDMLKIGTMVMNRGVFEGKRLIGEEWLRESFKTYTHSPHSHYDYGYMWWNHLVGEYRVNFAWGYAGQYILMLPELDTVVAITSDLASNNGDRTYQDQIFSFLGSSLIPWLESYGHLAGR